MSSELIPMRWPTQWLNPSALERLTNTQINCLLVEDHASLRSVIEDAQRSGIQVILAGTESPGITVIQGEWPGIMMTRSSDRDTASAGPTGLPWVNSNGWKVRLAAALNPQSTIWVDVAPPKTPLPGSYQLCCADIAACGGQWIITLDDRLAAGMEAGDRDSLETWKDLNQNVEFFATHKDWSAYVGAAVVGIVSSFSGDNEFSSRELLNLLTRTIEQYRIVPKKRLSADLLSDLQAALYLDSDPPTADVRRHLLNFVETGGLLITTPAWGTIPGKSAPWDHPRYACNEFGKGRIAVAKSGEDADPYLMANDTVALVSHRFDLLRFWDAGAVNAYMSVAADRKRALVQMVFYAWEMNGKVAMHGPENATVRVAGRYRAAQLLILDQKKRTLTLGQPGDDDIGMVIARDSVELHLPPLSHYAAVELVV